MSRMRPWLDAALPLGVLVLMGYSLLGGPVSEGIARLVQQNGAVLLLVVVLMQWAPQAIESQRAQARALGELTEAIRELPRRDDLKFEQVLVGLQYVAQELKEVKQKLDAREEHRG